MKKLHMFKNDPLNIKRKWFSWQTSRIFRKLVKANLRVMEVAQYEIYAIGIPENNEEMQELRHCLIIYDKAIQDLEKFLKYDRMYVKEEN